MCIQCNFMWAGERVKELLHVYANDGSDYSVLKLRADFYPA